jgi:hypothetical protein
VRSSLAVVDNRRVIVFRVWFVGPELDDPRAADFAESDALIPALAAAGAAWEGTRSGPMLPDRHRALIEAPTAEEAMTRVAAALTSHGSFTQFSVESVKDALGEARHGPYYRRWEEIDWQSVPERAKLSEGERSVLFSLADADEPTWIVADALGASRAEVEVILRRLQESNLVYSVLEWSGEPGKAEQSDHWWAITDEGWDMLGMIKSPRYQ